jgi:putative sterol carrier protein
MTETAREFFESLSERVDVAKLAGETVSYRFDVGGAGSWVVDVRDGEISVEESSADADCVIQFSEETFEKLRDGRTGVTPAFVTGKLKVKGDMALAMKLRELFFSG